MAAAAAWTDELAIVGGLAEGGTAGTAGGFGAADAGGGGGGGGLLPPIPNNLSAPLIKLPISLSSP